jgi:hypothetical protein
MRALLVMALALAAAVAALFINIALLTHASPSHDPIGRLSPRSATVRTHPVPVGGPRLIRELPDD